MSGAAKPDNPLQIQHWLRILTLFDLRTILGRLILSTSLLVLTTLIVAWIAQAKFTTSAEISTARFANRVNIQSQITTLRSLLWETETQFQNYMLTPKSELKIAVIVSIDKLIAGTDQLLMVNWIAQDRQYIIMLNSFKTKGTRLKLKLTDIMTMRADPLLLFPAMPIMVAELNPRNRRVTNTISLALLEADEMSGEEGQEEIKALFQEIRFAWIQKINTFRILISSRVGIFRGSLDKMINDSLADIALYRNQNKILLNRLSTYHKKKLLGFQQSDALTELKSLTKKWHTHFVYVKDTITHQHKWRKDTPILKTIITPLFSDLWQDLQDLGTSLESRAEQELEQNTQIYTEVSNSLWILVFSIFLIMAISTLLFEFQIRRPLIRLARALKAEAKGEEEISLPKSSITETRDLISAFANMRQEVHSRQEHLQAVLTYAADGIITTDINGLIRNINPAAGIMLGISAEQALGSSISDYIENITEILTEHSGKEHESFAQHIHHGHFPVGLRVSGMQVDGENLLLIMIADIRERRKMLEDIQAREQRLRSIMDTAAEAIVTFDDNDHIENWNQAAEQLFGWQESEVIGNRFSQYVFSESISQNKPDGNFTALTEGVGHESEVTGVHKKGNSIPLSLKISKMMLEGKQKYTALLANISERKAMMENLRYVAEHDSLTSLFNRAYFHDHLEETCLQARSGTMNLALLYIDLDNFKYVNDTLGHLAGDTLLVEVSTLLNMRTRRSDLVARLGGDEFVVLISDVHADTIKPIAESYRHALTEYQFKYEGKTVDVGCSIGVTLINQKTISSSNVLAQADVACHLAKRAGRNRVHVFTSDDETSVDNMSLDIGWSRRIHDALEHDKFVLVTQPIYTTITRTVSSYEVLVRMQDDDGTLIMPGGFFSTAERFGLAVKIDMWVIENAIKQLAALHKIDNKINFSINLSGQSVTVPEVIASIANHLATYNINASKLTFEITETAAISDMDKAVLLLEELRKMGCRTALDDFGSGMSSFAYLQEMPVDIVKIDGRFVKNISDNKVDRAIVSAMNDIAHALGKTTVAEFVEKDAHYQTLKAIGVDCVQGYYLGRPEPIQNLRDKYRKNLSA